MKVLSDQNKFLEAQVNELKGNIGEAERQNKSIKQELDCEITAHQEAKSNWKLTQNHLEDDQNEQSVEISKVSSNAEYTHKLCFVQLHLKCLILSFRVLCR
jgi:predicted RNase H-like nuclease (RuvC/YqgF family)